MNFPIVVLTFAVLMGSPAGAQTVTTAKREMIQESIARYPGNCPCPFNRASNGSRCGGRSAWSRPGGRSPICYADDISDQMVRSWMQRNSMAVSTTSGQTSQAQRETIRAVQAELNRVGCSTGVPDGVIGPNSRAALKKYSDATGAPFQVADFRSQLFLRKIASVTVNICGS